MPRQENIFKAEWICRVCMQVRDEPKYDSDMNEGSTDICMEGISNEASMYGWMGSLETTRNTQELSNE